MNKQTLIIDFPLRGEWLTEVSPAYHIPSHGTNRFGLRYAFDFIQSKEKNGRRVTHNSSQIAYFIKGVSLERYYCFNQPIFAPFSGQVVVIENSISDGQKASWFRDQLGAIYNSLFLIQKETALHLLLEIM